MAWNADKPAGTDLISTLDTNIQANNDALEAILQGMSGFRNLKIVRTSVTVVTVTADALFLQSSTAGVLGHYQTSVSEAIDITVSGASGLDTGAEAANTIYYIWILR